MVSSMFTESSGDVLWTITVHIDIQESHLLYLVKFGPFEQGPPVLRRLSVLLEVDLSQQTR
jgi:hypothetical protein